MMQLKHDNDKTDRTIASRWQVMKAHPGPLDGWQLQCDFNQASYFNSLATQ
jgi:hypothetical protein